MRKREVLSGTHEQDSSQGAISGVLRGPLKCLVMLQVESLHLSIERSTNIKCVAFAGDPPS